jgi:acetyltransferase
MPDGHPESMQSEFVNGVTVRPLRNGETAIVQAVFDGLGPRSRLLRFGGAKNELRCADLELLARVDATHHVLVAFAERRPVGIARLVRDGATAEVAFEVVDEWQGRGVGRLLVARLAADARAAGIVRLVGDIRDENPASRALLRRARLAVA